MFYENIKYIFYDVYIFIHLKYKMSEPQNNNPIRKIFYWLKCF